jgi:tRNA(Arg) A34 adenosine deaminase TadA
MRATKEFMLLALKEARRNLKDMRGGPFGACIVKNGKVISVARNTVLKDNDATCHAEINAIRKASKKLNDFRLTGCAIYSTTEPCPMCFSAIHWARLEAVVFGTSISDAKKIGFNELSIPAKKMQTKGASDVRIISAFLQKECRNLFQDWAKLKDRRVY